MTLLPSALEAAFAGYLRTISELSGVTILEGHAVAKIEEPERYIAVDARLGVGRFAHAAIYDCDITIHCVGAATAVGRQRHEQDVAAVLAALAQSQRSAVLAYVATLDQPGLTGWRWQGATEGRDPERKRLGVSLGWTVTAHPR